MERGSSPAPKKGSSKLSPAAKPFRSRGGSSSDSASSSEAKPLPTRPDASSKKKPARTIKPCRFFQQGNCKRGAECQFLHEVVPAPPAPAAAMAAAPAPTRLSRDGQDNDSSSSSSLGAMSDDPGPTYVCPFCENSYTEAELGAHLQEHSGENATQTCPICAAQPDGDPNYKSQDLFGHFALRHGAPTRRGRTLVSSGGPGQAAAGGAVFSFGGRKNEGQEVPAKVMKTCHAIDNSLRGMQSRGVDFIWEYAWRVDSGSEARMLETPCSACQGHLALSEPRALLPCGCSFHAGCVANDQHVGQCPVCKKAV